MMAESFPMNGGDGADSYSKNSHFQKYGSDLAKEMLRAAIVEKIETISTPFTIADLGCSIGPNTFFSIQTLIEAVQEKCHFQGVDSTKIEFQAFFNDHTDNDFNTLFALIPPDHRQLYYASGVPGSFYGRLFPRASINMMYSSYALHWLSRVPDGVRDRDSMAWNEGKIHYMGSRPPVIEAYADQFEKDMGGFISARADEIVSGGLMVLIMPGRPDGAVSQVQSVLFDFLVSSLTDMASEGIIDRAEIDAFNLPIYNPSVAEMTKVIETNGNFSIEKIELITLPLTKEALSADILMKHVRAATEGVFNKHFGKTVVDQMFNRIEGKKEQLSHLLASGLFTEAQFFVVLKRK